MKVTGARNEAYSALRRRAPAAGGAASASAQGRGRDQVDFLGVPEADLTAPVQGALKTLLGEIDELRGEVGRLKAQLAEAENLADRDALTPALNRRAFLRELGRVQAFVQRYGADASLAYFDVDGLKAVNDRLGHAAGDEALKGLAQQLIAHVRESDVVGRMGGDEFAVILVQADQPSAEAKAQALAQAVARELGALSVSWGVAQITPAADPEAIVAAADAAMYARKRDRPRGG